MLKLALFLMSFALIYSQIISVAGKGTINVSPDIAIISITITALASTAQLAQADVDAIVNTIKGTLSGLNIPSSDIETTSLYIYPQYNYTNGTQVLIGSQATQSISVIVRNIAPNGVRLANVIDTLALISGIQLTGVTFGLSNPANANKQARTIAWNDAVTKATQIATLSSLTIRKPQKIIDNPTPLTTNNVYIYAQQIPQISPTTIQEGVIQVLVTVLVTFLAQ